MAATGLRAHHSPTGFDQRRVVQIKGTVAKVEIRNPHNLLLLDVKEADGKALRWWIEISAGGIREWGKETLKAGDQIAVCGFPPLLQGRTAVIPEKEPGLDASRALWIGEIILPDGNRLEFLPAGARCPRFG